MLRDLLSVGRLTPKCSATSLFLTVGSSSIACAFLISDGDSFARRPPLRPLALAASKPAFVLSEINRRSNYAIEPII